MLFSYFYTLLTHSLFTPVPNPVLEEMTDTVTHSDTHSDSVMYESRLHTHLEKILTSPPKKHTFLTHSLHTSQIDSNELNRMCQSVINVNDKADFVLIKMIRLLYFESECESLVQSQRVVDQALAKFPFWIRKEKGNGEYSAIEKIVFWSENHTFMFLSSAHLFYQRSKRLGLECLANEREELLLRAYLDAHVAFNGVYEILSCTYLPYTISSLLNLYDYSEDCIVQEKARVLLDKIISQLLLVCNIDGVCNLAASARQYPAFRFRNFGHNVNQLISLCTGHSADPINGSPLADFLLTSSYRVTDDLIQKHWQFSGFYSQRVNHETAATKAIYENTGIDSLDCTTFYWSAGLVAHPRFVGHTKAFQKEYNLHELPGIKYLDFIPSALVESAMQSYSSLASGQNYTDIVLNVYKTYNMKAVLSSFENFNVNLRSFQQNPWMANIAGAPLWTQSGSLGKKIIPCINDFCPSVTQKGNIALIVYAAPQHRDGTISRIYSNNMTYVTWPRHYFEAEIRMSPDGVCGPPPDNLPGVKVASARTMGVEVDENTKAMLRQSVFKGEDKNSWWIGLRDSCYVGVYCSHESSEVFSEEKGFPKMQMFPEDEKNFLPRRVCSRSNHAWVVAVGDSITYPTLFDFISYCKCINVHVERHGNSSYEAVVKDVNWELSTRVNK